MEIVIYLDADHAGNLETWGSHTQILVYLNNSLIILFSRWQKRVDYSCFGSEFVALRIAKELLVSLRYKLRMFGIPIDVFAAVFCENQYVIKNFTLPQSVLKKRHNTICYHIVCESQVSEVIKVG